MERVFSFCVAVGIAVGSCGASGDHPWASEVRFYDAGIGVTPGYDDPTAALGEPTRFTGEGIFPGAVTPFNSAWMETEIVSIGRGGSLIVAFDRPIVNDPLNPFGIDLLVFGNSFYFDDDFPHGRAGMLSADGGIIEVSQDGDEWRTIPNAAADGLHPTLGYRDLTDPFSPVRGMIETDFTKPVDPSFVATGLTFAEIVAGYDGSGGGTGVDIGLVGFDFILYVRISNPMDNPFTVEIDGFAIVRPVPGPAAALVLGAGVMVISRRRRGSR
ncbi:MAG: hypothetical protein KF866_00530 [Phycisphaeraceae bacterium]|nr:hypothetical protein [Phycisphaeraceae bacterium]MCW5755170.1 hypothetical protein [Phycisphaeraceae bacterium]